MIFDQLGGWYRALDWFTRHEGYAKTPYVDTAGKITIGVGRNLSDRGLTDSEIFAMFQHDCLIAEYELQKFHWWETIDGPWRKASLLNMMFNLGAPRFRTFKKMIAALEQGDYDRAAEEMRDSKWARQVGQRATELAEMVRANTPGGFEQ